MADSIPPTPPNAVPGGGDPIASMLGMTVVMDTAGPIVFLGRLCAVTPEGFWLEDADIHDRQEGHATKELYVCEARLHGVRANRRRLFVQRAVVISASCLEDVIVD